MTWFECIVAFFAGYGLTSLLSSLAQLALYYARR
jgi:hypothetical protein